jgi:hypothetical protein
MPGAGVIVDQTGSILLDTLADPGELKNLAGEPIQAKTVQQMKSLFQQLAQLNPR